LVQMIFRAILSQPHAVGRQRSTSRICTVIFMGISTGAFTTGFLPPMVPSMTSRPEMEVGCILLISAL
jgi:uncharacterized membrane protein YfcA